MLQVHGTDDPCWGYTTSTVSCLSGDADKKLGVAESMEGWRKRNTCADTPKETKLPNTDPGDGTTTTRFEWQGCKANVVLLRIDGGGHTWPGGYAYFAEDRIGRVGRDFGSEEIVAFFLANPKP